MAWRTAAQDWLYAANDREPPTFDAWFDGINTAWGPLGNVALPVEEEDPSSLLLPLMRRWRSEVEEWMSLRITDADTEPARLRMNATIQDVSALLESECGLEPLRLYESRPVGSAS